MLTFKPISAEQQPLLDRFCNAHGKFRYCACMRWRMTSTEFRQSSKQTRVQALNDLVQAGTQIGVLAVRDDVPVGWCSVAPKTEYRRLQRYKPLRPIDDQFAWAVVCFFIAASDRRQGLPGKLLMAARDYALSEGATIVEGYPVDPGSASYTWMGSPALFRAAGFEDATPPNSERMTMRFTQSE